MQVCRHAYGDQRSTLGVIAQDLSSLIFKAGSLTGLELKK